MATQLIKSGVNDVGRGVKDAMADNKWDKTSFINNYPPQAARPALIGALLFISTL